MGMSLHPPTTPSSPFIPSLTVSKTKRYRATLEPGGGQLTRIISIIIIIIIIQFSPPLLPGPPSPTLSVILVSLPVYVCTCMCISVRACVHCAHQTNTDGLTGPLEQNSKKEREEEGRPRTKEIKSSTLGMGTFHACGSSVHHLG